MSNYTLYKPILNFIKVTRSYLSSYSTTIILPRHLSHQSHHRRLSSRNRCWRLRSGCEPRLQYRKGPIVDGLLLTWPPLHPAVPRKQGI